MSSRPMLESMITGLACEDIKIINTGCYITNNCSLVLLDQHFISQETGSHSLEHHYAAFPTNFIYHGNKSRGGCPDCYSTVSCKTGLSPLRFF